MAGVRVASDLEFILPAIETSLTAVTTVGGAITGISWAAGTATVTQSLNHGLVAGNPIVIQGANFTGGPGLNGTYNVVTVPSLTTYTIAVPTSPGNYQNGGTTTYQLFDTSAVFISEADEEVATAPNMDMMLVLGPAEFDFNQSAVWGGGLDALLQEGLLGVTLYVRLQTDIVQRDDQFFLDLALGAKAKFRAVIKNLQLLDPTNSNGDYILAEPMRLVTWRARLRKPIAGWGRIESTWELKYVQQIP